jgi:glycosyltransferase involved in cell wall biosynthesis
METLKTFWDIPDKTVEKFIDKVEFQYNHFQLEKGYGPFSNYIDEEGLLNKKREKLHVLIGILGFSSGGGELFPIHLANQLQESGCIVSLFVYDMSSINQDMYSVLNKRIAVYSSSHVQKMGVENFVRDAGISLIHSHMIAVEAFFFNHNRVKLNIPYLVTLHGSYDFVTSPEQSLKNIVKSVDCWVYTADKNLDILQSFQISKDRFIKFPNAMPVDNEDFPLSREELGIADDAVVFTFVARGIRSKGWEVAILAFIQLRNENPDVPMHLLLCGDGEETKRCENQYGNNPDITFLGYQSRINGLYRISDCAIVPTRFKGESYPLILIQAMQEGLPIIATDTGEIKNIIIGDNEEAAGILVENTEDTIKFINDFEKAMHKMLDASTRSRFQQSAIKMGEKHNIQNVADQYIDFYRKMTGSI